MSDPLQFTYESMPALWLCYYDPEGPVGHGKTKAEALGDLFDMCDDDHGGPLLLGAIVAAIPGDARVVARPSDPYKTVFGIDAPGVARHANGCFNDQAGAVLCQVCGGDLPPADEFDHSERWNRVQELALAIAHKDEAPTEVESALCWVVVRLREEDEARARADVKPLKAGKYQREALIQERAALFQKHRPDGGLTVVEGRRLDVLNEMLGGDPFDRGTPSPVARSETDRG